MSIKTLTELQTAVENWLNRADLTDRIPEFIALAEATFNRILRVQDMIKREGITFSGDEGTDVPDDWLETYSLRIDTNPVVLPEYLRPQDFHLIQSSKTDGLPRYFTILNRELVVYPRAGDSVTGEHVYYSRIPALTTQAPTNWLLSSHPDIYLFGALLQAEPYLKNDERVQIWAAMFKGTTDSLAMASERAMRPTGGLQVTKRTFG